MRAVIIHAAGDLRVEDRPEPAAPGPGEVRVGIARGGICGSDLHYLHHGGFGAVRLREPMALGHEAAGVVEAVGAGVEGLALGDRVAVNPSRPCGACASCRRGLRNHCLDMRFSGSAMRMPHEEGLFREAVVVPAAQAVRLSAQADLGRAACAEPLAVGLHAARRAGSLLGARVLVSGCGPIGCLTVAAARHAGASHVVATDLAPEALAVAEAMGAHETIDLSASPQGLDPWRAGKGRVDVAFECSGAAPALRAACEALRPRGALVTVGLGPDVPLPLGLVVTKEIALRGSFRFDEEFALAADLIDRGAIDLGPLVTHALPAEDAAAAFAIASDRRRAMKVQLRFREP